jgi:hypothetical protein
MPGPQQFNREAPRGKQARSRRERHPRNYPDALYRIVLELQMNPE